VTPLRDGMTLSPRNTLRPRIRRIRGPDPVPLAGAAIEFRRALLVNPYDPESVAGAIAQALTMPIEEAARAPPGAACRGPRLRRRPWQREFLTALRGDDVMGTFQIRGAPTSARPQKPEITCTWPRPARWNSVR